MSNLQPVRVRFAPSPTGYLHVGGLRTALYNYLFARKLKGAFVLRIEDTDRSRYVEGAIESLIETFRWVGLTYDEGPDVGGPYGPYVQSERLAIYRAHVDELLSKGDAYRCFCTPERLDVMRKELESRRMTPKYDRLCLKLSDQQISSNLSSGLPYVVRMKVPDNGSVSFDDQLRGHLDFSSEMIDDQVLLKSDGYPTYHLANVVDDHHMLITHVIRGEEWLSSTPKHVLLYDFFGWRRPVFAHLPLLLNKDRSKLSKRQGDVAVEDYRAKGYLKEAILNFVAFLGWNPGTEQDLFTIEELIDQFSLERVGSAGAIFNVEKLNWFNFQHLRRKPDEEVLQMLKDEISRSKYRDRQFDDQYLREVITAMRERVTFVKDFLEKSAYFFEAPTHYDPEVVRKRWGPDTAQNLRLLGQHFAGLENPSSADFESALHSAASSLKIANADLIHGLRLAVSGVGGGPGVYDILKILGKEETIRRIARACETIA